MDFRTDELIRLSRDLVERDGQRLFRARNSPAIVRIEKGDKVFTIKRVRRRLMITLTLKPSNTRTCIYDNGPEGDDLICSTVWQDDYQPFLDEIRRRLVLESIVFGAERNT